MPTFKDNDFTNSGEKLVLGEENKKKLMERLQADVNVRHRLWHALYITVVCDLGQAFSERGGRERKERERERESPA